MRDNMDKYMHEKNRPNYIIIRDILVAVRDNCNVDGLVTSKINQVAGTAFAHGYKILSELVGAGLVETENNETSVCYKITGKGISFIESLEKFHKVADGIGIRTSDSAETQA